MTLIIFFSRIFIISILYIFLATCSVEQEPIGPDPPSDEDFQNPIFGSSELITTGTPLNDDTTSSRPTFTWQSIGNKLVFLGIFTDNLDVHNNTIVNHKENIWAWHTGIGKGREGNVDFKDGYTVLNGVIQEGIVSQPLDTGRAYIWAVWAWNDEGTEITHSSREIFFFVK